MELNYPRDPYVNEIDDNDDTDAYYEAIVNDDFEAFREILAKQNIEDDLAWQVFCASRRDIMSIDRTNSYLGFEDEPVRYRRHRYDAEPEELDDDDLDLDQDDVSDYSSDLPPTFDPVNGIDTSDFGVGYFGDGVGDISEAKALDFTQRRKRAMVMKRMKSRLKVARRIASKRTATVGKLKQRAKVAARNVLKRRMSGQKNYSNLSAAQKQAVDKRFARVSPAALNRIALKMMPTVRKREVNRMRSRMSRKKNESVEDPHPALNLTSLVEETVLAMQAEGVADLVTFKQVKTFEKVVDSLFKKFNIDFNFTRHFADRISDERNTPAITIEELASLFKKIYNKVKAGDQTLSKFGDVEAVLKDLQTDINVPIAIEYDRRGDDLVVAAKTIMRKRNFSTPNRVLRF